MKNDITSSTTKWSIRQFYFRKTTSTFGSNRHRNHKFQRDAIDGQYQEYRIRQLEHTSKYARLDAWSDGNIGRSDFSQNCGIRKLWKTAKFVSWCKLIAEHVESFRRTSATHRHLLSSICREFCRNLTSYFFLVYVVDSGNWTDLREKKCQNDCRHLSWRLDGNECRVHAETCDQFVMHCV